MSSEVGKPSSTGTGLAKAKDSRCGNARMQHLPNARRRAVPDIVVEEIFLEGDGMTMLRHEAGSTRTIDLLDPADALDPAAGQPK